MKKFLLLILVCCAAGAIAKPSKTTKPVKPKLMWFDAEANFKRLSYKDSIDFYLNKIKEVGFTDVVLDVRPILGEVLYDSKFAPKMKDWDGFVRPNFDFVGYFVKKSHKLGLKIHFSLNVFVAGHNYFDRGQCYSTNPEWASVVYDPEMGMTSIMNQKKKYSAMVNPINPDFQKHILNVLTEVVKKYPKVDGLVLDRVRYDGIQGDFSDLSRKEFEKYIGQKIENYPADIYEWKKDKDGKYFYAKGKHFNKWIEWRTKNIYDFMALARKTVKAANPKVSFGTYTGAWYPSYFEVGVNWASNSYDPSKDYEWATADYKKYGYAELLDLYTTGNYYLDVTKADYFKHNRLVVNETDSHAQQGLWYCIEGSCEKIRGILNERPVIGGILADMYYENPSELARAVEMNLKASDGLMVFDIVHIIHKNMWNELEKGIKNSGE